MKERVFKEMQNIGWNLTPIMVANEDKSFELTFYEHLHRLNDRYNTMIETESVKTIEDEYLVEDLAFITDFLECLDTIDNGGLENEIN